MIKISHDKKNKDKQSEEIIATIVVIFPNIFFSLLFTASKREENVERLNSEYEITCCVRCRSLGQSYYQMQSPTKL